MRAVNLVPGDQRRGGVGTPGRSGAAVYVLLGALTVLVLAAAAYVLVGNQVNSRKADLAHSRDEAAHLEQQAAALRPYTEFASLSRTRVQTVASLAASRFNWDRTLRQLGQMLPQDVWLTSLVGTVTPGVTIEDAGSGGATSSLRNALQVPAIELVGCTESQAQVSRVIARLRTLNGVQRVSLAASEKAQNASGSSSGGSGASASDCRNGSSRFPQFQLVIFFKAPSGAASPAAPGQPGSPQGQPGSPQSGQPAGTPTSSGGTQ